MANDKNFKIKNGLSAAQYLQSSTALSASDVDLSTGSYFSKTLSANTTFTFSNPPASGTAMGFLLNVTGGSGEGVSNSSYDSKLLDYGSQTLYARGIAWKTDGSRIYIVSSGTASTRRVYQYNLSTSWDVSTASYSTNDDISGQVSSPEGIDFKPDGTAMYVVDRDYDTVYQYTLSTAWAVNTASYASKSFSVAGQETQPTGVRFKSDGTKMYIVGFTGDDINEYNLSTAWDVSTASYSARFSIASQSTTPTGLSFNSDGTFVVVSDNDSPPTAFSYSLSTAWDITSASFIDEYDVSAVVNSGDFQDIALGDSDGKFYAIDNNDDEVNQFTASGPAATITWPSSVKWDSATTPDAPASGDKNIYAFVTTDGGTTYYGKLAGSGMA